MHGHGRGGPGGPGRHSGPHGFGGPHGPRGFGGPHGPRGFGGPHRPPRHHGYGGGCLGCCIPTVLTITAVVMGIVMFL